MKIKFASQRNRRERRYSELGRRSSKTAEISLQPPSDLATRSEEGRHVELSQQAGPSKYGFISNTQFPIPDAATFREEAQAVVVINNRRISSDQKLGLEFDREIAKIAWNECNNCHRKFLELRTIRGICLHCAPPRLSRAPTEEREKFIHKFTAFNNMDPGLIPDELSDLSHIEEMLIARVHPVVCLYRIKGGQYGYTGNVINFRQDLTTLFNKLPMLPSQSQAIMIAKQCPNGISYLKIRSAKVRNALIWLQRNNRYYQDIEIDHEVINTLPIDGDATHLISQILDIQAADEVKENESLFSESFFPSLREINQEEQIQQELSHDITWPRQESIPINEFREEGYIAQAFPTLFPYGGADFLQPRIQRVTLNEYFKFLFMYKDGRFAKHPRFCFFAMNTQMRQMALAAGDVYVKRNAIRDLTRNNFQDMVHNDRNLADSIMFYAGKLRTSKSYWRQRCGELLDMVNQIGKPDIFFTLSAADYHWTDLFRLLSDNAETLTDQERRKLMHENPLFTAHFFVKRA